MFYDISIIVYFLFGLMMLSLNYEHNALFSAICCR